MRAWFFEPQSYKRLLSRLLEQDGQTRGIISRAADAIGCQRSYLSQVLHGKVHLTRDQAWGLCRFFHLNPDESTYFETLVDFERASSAAYKKYLEDKLDILRKDASQIAKQFSESAGFSEPDALDYFASWLPSAVHILTSIKEYQDPAKIAARLQINPERVREALQQLEEKGLVKHEKNRWVFGKGVGYVPRESTYVTLHHQNWRQEAVEDARSSKSEGMHYTMVQSISKKDFEALKGVVLEFIARAKKIAEPSEPELLTTMNIDFFQPR